MSIDLSAPETWPTVMTLAEVASVARLAPATVQKQNARGVFRPAALEGKPLRWRRCDVVREFAPVSMPVQRRTA